MFLGKSAGGAATATQTKAIRNCSQTSSLQTLDIAIILKLRILKNCEFFGVHLAIDGCPGRTNWLIAVLKRGSKASQKWSKFNSTIRTRCAEGF